MEGISIHPPRNKCHMSVIKKGFELTHSNNALTQNENMYQTGPYLLCVVFLFLVPGEGGGGGGEGVKIWI